MKAIRESLLLFGGYIVYLLAGAYIFQRLEHPSELKKCDRAKGKTINFLKIQLFLRKNFVTLIKP
jgi:hypothetical protein